MVNYYSKQSYRYTYYRQYKLYKIYNILSFYLDTENSNIENINIENINIENVNSYNNGDNEIMELDIINNDTSDEKEDNSIITNDNILNSTINIPSSNILDSILTNTSKSNILPGNIKSNIHIINELIYHLIHILQEQPEFIYTTFIYLCTYNNNVSSTRNNFLITFNKMILALATKSKSQLYKVGKKRKLNNNLSFAFILGNNSDSDINNEENLPDEEDLEKMKSNPKKESRFNIIENKVNLILLESESGSLYRNTNFRRLYIQSSIYLTEYFINQNLFELAYNNISIIVQSPVFKKVKDWRILTLHGNICYELCKQGLTLSVKKVSFKDTNTDDDSDNELLIDTKVDDNYTGYWKGIDSLYTAARIYPFDSSIIHLLVQFLLLYGHDRVNMPTVKLETPSLENFEYIENHAASETKFPRCNFKYELVLADFKPMYKSLCNELTEVRSQFEHFLLNAPNPLSIIPLFLNFVHYYGGWTFDSIHQVLLFWILKDPRNDICLQYFRLYTSMNIIPQRDYFHCLCIRIETFYSNAQPATNTWTLLWELLLRMIFDYRPYFARYRDRWTIYSELPEPNEYLKIKAQTLNFLYE